MDPTPRKSINVGVAGATESWSDGNGEGAAKQHCNDVVELPEYDTALAFLGSFVPAQFSTHFR